MPGLKLAQVQNSKLTITEKMSKSLAEEEEVKPTITKVKIQKEYENLEYVQPKPPTPEKPKESSKEQEDASKALINQIQKIEEGLYDPEGYDVGRYNLRRRAAQKKYYDEDPDLDEELGMEPDPRIAYQYASNYKAGSRNQVYTANTNTARRGGSNDAKFQTKSKRRKKKDDDEDYVESEDDDGDYNDDYSLNSKKNQLGQQPMRQLPQNLPQKMPGNFPMPNQFGMQNPMMAQTQISRFMNFPLFFKYLYSLDQNRNRFVPPFALFFLNLI